MRGPLDASGAARVEVLIDPGNGRTRKMAGLLDTGASTSFIPQAVASEMGLTPRAWYQVGSIHREAKEPGFYVVLTIEGLFEGTVAIVEMKPAYDFVVVGRNVLKHLRLVFDGPGGMFELDRPGQAD